MSFADKVKKLVDEAPVASTGVNVNFGPLVVTPLVLKWQGRGQGAKPDKTPLDQYMKDHGLSESDDVELEAGESFQIHFDIDVSELNPNLDFHYERDVAILESGEKQKTSWAEIVQPSLEKTFGKDWYNKILPNGKKAAPVLFVAAENVDAVEPVKKGGKNYGVPKFIAVYKDLDACRKARDERYPPREETGVDLESDDDEGVADDSFPEDVISQVKDLYNSTRKNPKQTKKMLESNPFGEYDVKELMQAAEIDITGIKF